METVNTKKIEETVNTELTVVKQFQVTNQDQYDAGGRLLIRLQNAKKQVNETFEEPEEAAAEAKRAAERTRRAVVEAKDKFLSPLEKAMATVKGVMADWWASEQKKKAALEAETRRQQEEEAEKQRKKDVRALKAEGKVAEAKELSKAPLAIASVALEGPAKVSGVVNVVRWDAELVDIKALCAAIAKDEVPPTYVNANMVALRQEAVARKEHFKIPGVRAVRKEDISVRA